MAAEETPETPETQLGDLPEACLAYAIALTSPRDACRCAAVSPSFRAAADSDHVWRRFIPDLDRRPVASVGLLQEQQEPTDKARRRKKDAYLGLCDDRGGVPVDGDAGCRVWLDKASGAKCYALSARRLSLPWDDGEFSWLWKPHPRSRFAEVAELMDCTCLDIYGRLPSALLTPSTEYAAHLVYTTSEADGQCRGLSYPDQETTVAVGGRVVARHRVCLRPDDAETRKFRRAGLGLGAGDEGVVAVREEETRRPRSRDDEWWEMEMGRVRTPEVVAEGEGEDVVASFEVFGWYPKRGLVVEGVEFRPAHG